MATDNRPDGLATKVELRRRLLDRVAPSRVLDVFCGVDGEMHRAVWCEADEYLGMDRRYDALSETRPRVVGDSLSLLGAMRLERWSIFDLDAWGDPCAAMLELAYASPWVAGRRYGIAMTDGSQAKLKFGSMSESQADLLGRPSKRFVYRGQEQVEAMQRKCFARWLKRCGLRMLEGWEAVSLAGQSGSNAMRYSAAVLEAIC